MLLPAVNLKTEFSPEVLIRLSAAKVMANADLNALGQGFDKFYSNGVFFGGQRGNPELSQFEANSFDSAVEWYFDKTGLLATTLFYKDIKSFNFDNIVFS